MNTVDEWLGAGTEWLGGKFGVDSEVARSVGESLPRMVVDFLPMAAGAALAPFTGGASLPIGMAATSGLSAANAYEQSGSLADAAIGGVAPYLGRISPHICSSTDTVSYSTSYALRTRLSSAFRRFLFSGVEFSLHPRRGAPACRRTHPPRRAS